MATRQWNRLVRHVRRLLGPAESAVQTDRQLLHCFAETRDEAAFGQLVERHGPMVLGVCRRLLHDSQEAEDAFQATFWALARKAGSIAWQDSIGSWLYAVACRVALKARTRSTRRRQLDREAAAMRSEPAPTTDSDAELRALLDVELQRLPEKYRAPLILCYLEGQTNEEAALQLGWPKGTVQGRLARARDVLRGRLLRRGVGLAGAVLALLETPPAPAALSKTLMQTTIRYAVDPESAPASMISLAEGVLRSIMIHPNCFGGNSLRLSQQTNPPPSLHSQAEHEKPTLSLTHSLWGRTFRTDCTEPLKKALFLCTKRDSGVCTEMY